MTATRSERAFQWALGLTVVVALFFPTSWVRPWSNALAAIVSVPVQPLGDFGARLSKWLWPPVDPLAAEPERIQKLEEQLALARQIAHAKQLRIESLQEELFELQRSRRFDDGGGDIQSIFARITARGSGGLVKLNVGARNGVTGGAVAIYRGVHVLGRVSEDVSPVSSWLIPLTDSSTGLIEVILVPPDDPDPPMDAAPRVQLSPDGGGRLVGELDRDVPVRSGDLAELYDPIWPAAAQGLKVGTVVSVKPKEAHPLLNEIVIRPQYQPHRLTSVILLIERSSPVVGGGEEAAQ